MTLHFHALRNNARIEVPSSEFPVSHQGQQQRAEKGPPLYMYIKNDGRNVDTHQHAIVQALPGLGGCPKGGWVVLQMQDENEQKR